MVKFRIMARANDGSDGDGGTIIERRTKQQTKTKKPTLYKCILLNDDYTPMEFVVEILKHVFHKDTAEATRIMLHVHQNGMGVAGFIRMKSRRPRCALLRNWRARISFRLNA